MAIASHLAMFNFSSQQSAQLKIVVKSSWSAEDSCWVLAEA